MLFGAATHDIGKVWHLEEMSGPGQEHHQAGVELLQQQDVDAQRARFARTHGAWRSAEALEIEDLLVALADVIWAGGRNQALEDLVRQCEKHGTRVIVAGVQPEVAEVLERMDLGRDSGRLFHAESYDDALEQIASSRVGEAIPA